MEVFGGREKNRASCNKYRTFPARSSDPHRSYHSRTDESHSWTGPGSIRDSITWTNRVPPSNYSVENQPVPKHVGQKMEKWSEMKEKQRNGGNLMNEWQPEHNRREVGVGSTSYQELEAWASRYYHSLPRRKQNIGEKSGFAGRSIPEDPRLQHGFWKSKPPPPYMPVKPLSPEALPERTKILRPCFSHTPNYTPPPPYSSSQNTKEPDGTPVRGLTKVMMEPRFGRRPDHCNRTLKFSQTKSGDRALHSSRKYPDIYNTRQEPSTTVPPKPSENIRSAGSAPAQQSKPRRGFGGTVFCLVSHSEVSNPPNKAPQNHEKGKIQKVQLESHDGGSLTYNKKDLQASLVKHQDQTSKFPLWKEPTLLHCSKGLEKTPEPNQDQTEQASNANQNKGLVVIDATCVVVKAELLVPSEQELVQYVYKVQKNNSNAEESADRRSKHEKATQTSSLKVPENETPKVRSGRIRTVNWVPRNSKHLLPSQTENTGKVPKTQSAGRLENKESEGQLKEEATSEKSPIPNLAKSKVKESQSLVVKALRTSEGHGILVMKSSELDGSFEGRVKESPSDKIDMKNQCQANLTSVVNPGEIFGQNAGPVQETDSIESLSSIPFEICMENKKPFNQGRHPIDGGISDINGPFFGYHEGSDSQDDLKAERGGIPNPNPTILDNQMVTTYQTSDQDISASQSHDADDIQCSAQLDQQDRVHGSKPSNLHPDFDRDHPKIMCEMFGQEGHTKHLQAKIDVQGPHPVLKKLSEMFEHNRKRLCSPMVEDQVSKGDLLHSADQNLESSCVVFDQEPSNSTDDVTKASPSLFEDQMESKRSQERNRSEISFQDKIEDQEGCPKRSNAKPDANNFCHGNHMESTSDGSHGEGNLKTGAVDDVYPNFLVENLKDTSKPFDQEGSFYVENKSTSLDQEGSRVKKLVKKPAGIRNIGPNCLWDYVEELHEGSSVDKQPDKTTGIKNISTFLLKLVEPPDAEESSAEVNQLCGDKNIYSTLLHKHVDHLKPQQGCTWTTNFSDDILSSSENPTEQISQDGTSDLQTLQHVDDPDSAVPPSFSGTDCNRPDCGTCPALSNAAQSGSQGSSRSIKPKPRSIWDAVSRIRRHTAPDSESEEEEQSDDLWDSPDDEGFNLDGAMELEAGEPVLEMKLQDVIEGSDGDADVPPEESDDTQSSCSLESRGSNGTVIERLDVVERDGDDGGSDELRLDDGDNMNIKAESEFRRQSTS